MTLFIFVLCAADDTLYLFFVRPMTCLYLFFARPIMLFIFVLCAADDAVYNVL